MSEYWKSTPRYWCKHCSVYVRDTKLERQNHEATGKHQGAIKRFLRDLHRGHENEQREKERVKREIDRLNGVVGSSSSSSATGGSGSTGSSSAPASKPAAPASAATTEAQRQQQWEQLAAMGIDVPTELRGSMAMASEWTVTKTRVIDETPTTDEHGNPKVDALATGVRKRPKREGEDEEEEAVSGLFKKPRVWGRGPKHAAVPDDELDALLSGSLVPKAPPVKEEDTQIDGEKEKEGTVKKEEEAPSLEAERDAPSLKQEPDYEGQGIPDTVETKSEPAAADAVKAEPSTDAGVDVPAVVFKKRKPKNVRQK